MDIWYPFQVFQIFRPFLPKESQRKKNRNLIRTMIDSCTLSVESLWTLLHSHVFNIPLVLDQFENKQASVRSKSHTSHCAYHRATFSKTLHRFIVLLTICLAFCQGRRSPYHCLEVESMIAAIKLFLNTREHGRWSTTNCVYSRWRPSNRTRRPAHERAAARLLLC